MAVARERFSPILVEADVAGLAPLWGVRETGDETLAIHRGGTRVGVVGLDRQGARVQAIWAAGGAAAVVLAGLAEIAAAQPRRRFEVLVPDDPEPAPDLAATLADHGFTLILDQVHLRGTSAPPPAPGPSPLTYRRVAAADRRALLWLIARVWPDGTPLRLAPVDELAAIEAASSDAAGAPDRTLWRFAEHDGATAGFVLAHRHADDPGRGSLAAFGLVPELRGRGLGRALHRDALALLHAAGATAYHESTPATDAPMLALLRAAGCAEHGRTRVYVAGR